MGILHPPHPLHPPFFTKGSVFHHMTSVDKAMPQKSYDHMCNNTLVRTLKAIDNVCVNDAFPY